jgi:hypothetical protein
MLRLVGPRHNSLCNHVKIVHFLSLRSIGRREILDSPQKLFVLVFDCSNDCVLCRSVRSQLPLRIFTFLDDLQANTLINLLVPRFPCLSHY